MDHPDKLRFHIGFLVLPTVQILQADTTGKVRIYVPSGTAAKPVVTSVPKTLARGRSYKVARQQLAGIASGSAYGDDQQSDTKFPLVRMVNNKTQHVFYARISGFSSRGPKPKAASTASFLVRTAGKIETGSSSLFVVANGFQREGGAGHHQVGEPSAGDGQNRREERSSRWSASIGETSTAARVRAASLPGTAERRPGRPCQGS